MPDNRDNIEKLKRAIGIDFDHTHGSSSGNKEAFMPTEQIPVSPVQDIDRPIPNLLKTPLQPAPPVQNLSIQKQEIPSIQDIQIEKKQEIQKETVANPVFENNDNSLFVKIDRHQDIAAEINSAKNEMKNMLYTITLLNQAESLKTQAIEKLDNSLATFNTKLKTIESHLGIRLADNRDMHPEDTNAPNRAGKNVRELKDLHSDIQNLKTELSNIKI